MQIQFLSSTRKLVVAVAAGMALAGAGVLVAHAAGETGVPRLVHYEGYLEKGGIPYDSAPPNTALNAVFKLDNGSDSTPGALAYDYNVPAMAVSAGRFVVDIPIPAQHDWVFDQADHVYLTVSLDGTALNGRQRITPVPYAVRAAEAVQFRVKAGLDVAGNASAGGNISAAGVVSASGGFAGSGASLTSISPTMLFDDADQPGYHYWLHANDGRFYLLYDLNGDGAWDPPYPLYFEGRNAVFGGNVNAPSLTVSGSSGSNVPHNCGWVSGSDSGYLEMTATCPSGKKIVSGGCEAARGQFDPVAITMSSPSWLSWKCKFSGAPYYGVHRAQAFCCEF